MLAVSRQAHGVFLAWLNHDSLGPPGLQADLASGQARLDLDELLAGQQFGIGPLQVPMAGLDLPGLAVPVPLPPDWLRNPLTWLRAALLPALIGIALAAAAMLTLDRPRLRTLGVASASTAVVCGGAALTGRIFWRTSGAESADWQVTRAMTALLVDPLLTAYAWVGAAMFVVTAIALVRGRHHLVDAQPPA